MSKRCNSEITDDNIVRCKDCIYKPTYDSIKNEEINIHYCTEYKCPCMREVNWYSWIPDDNWFCANGETR